MTAFIKAAGMLLLITCSSAPGFADDVQTDFNAAVDFSKYKTYSWLKVDMPNDIWAQRARSAVDRMLVQKGWTRVDSGGDIAVSAIGTTSTKTELSTFYSGMDGWGWSGWGPDMASTVPIQYTEGTLIVDMFDTGSKQLIWRGTASDTLSDRPEKNAEKLNKAVEKMFKKFPPEPKNKKR